MRVSVKKPKKEFKSIQEKIEFQQNFRAKFKTEICKNWEAFGTCKFGDACSFAHGYDQI